MNSACMGGLFLSFTDFPVEITTRALKDSNQWHKEPIAQAMWYKNQVPYESICWRGINVAWRIGGSGKNRQYKNLLNAH